MSDQPEALRLAELFDLEDDPESLYRKTATELRRQHAEIEALKAERDEDRRREYGYSQQTVDALTQERDALRSLLERIVVAVDAGGVGFASNSEDFWNAIDAARADWQSGPIGRRTERGTPR